MRSFLLLLCSVEVERKEEKGATHGMCVIEVLVNFFLRLFEQYWMLPRFAFEITKAINNQHRGPHPIHLDLFRTRTSRIVYFVSKIEVSRTSP